MVDIFNPDLNQYIPAPLSQGMFVEVRGPDNDIILARVRHPF